MTDQQPPAGWYPDGNGGQRWWDGAAWTEHVPPSQEVTRVSGAPAPFAAPPGEPYAPPPGGPGGGRRGLVLALGGAGVLVVALVVVLVVVLAGRDGGSGGSGGSGGGDATDASSPEGVVQAYFDTAKEGSCDVVEYFSNEALGVGEGADRESTLSDARDRCADAGAFEEGDGAGCDLDLGSTEEEGDTATIEFEITGCDDPDDDDAGTASLVNEDGEWRISTFG